eukprot:TRINITY_DN8496_c0_g1_i1.p4 TRINITY_DN8496_c0_g1~~TRINITY_DN8496_c0_g1_i1.p4  ORF type:complete len:122 (+),score=21.13 TRINITY_DN8496_c0_g1_i1:1014-1379(+)
MKMPTSPVCERFREEVEDADSLLELLRRFESNASSAMPSASLLLVGFHNIVTSTVDLRFGNAKRHRYYCLEEVFHKLDHSLVPGAGVLSSWRSNASALESSMRIRGVPGLGSHRLRDCSGH